MSPPIILPTRKDLGQLLPARSIIAEIGVHRGYFAVSILEHWPVRHYYGVDRWAKATEYHDPLSNDDHEANYRETQHNLRGHRARVTLIRGASLEVAATDRSIPLLDAVYIDGDHSYAACLADLEAWSSRLKPGGLLMGHDYTENAAAKEWGFGVIPAVHDFCLTQGWTISHLTNEDFASYVLKKIP